MGEKRHSSTEELVKNALNGIYQSTPEGEFLTVNPALVRLLGYESEGELRATKFGDLIILFNDFRYIRHRFHCAHHLTLGVMEQGGIL